MNKNLVFLTFCIVSLLINISLLDRTSYAYQIEEDPVIKLDKRLHYNNLSDARAELTPQLLTPPVNLNTKKEEVHRKLGMPKEIYGFGTEFFRIKDANLTISYTTNDNGDVVVSNLEFRPNKEILWSNWLKPQVKLPSPPITYDKKSKIPIRITTQVRIDDAGNNKGWQITLIGNLSTVSYVSWNVVL
jgi:hypothetical protein